MPNSLHVIAGALVAEVATLGTLRATGTGWVRVREWYRTYGASAVLMDVTSVAFAAQVGVAVAGADWRRALLAALAVQQVHDVAFGAWLRRAVVPERDDVLGLFRRYADEVGVKILVADALIVAGAVAVAYAMAARNNGAVSSVALLSGYAALLLGHTDG